MLGYENVLADAEGYSACHRDCGALLYYDEKLDMMGCPKCRILGDDDYWNGIQED